MTTRNRGQSPTLFLLWHTNNVSLCCRVLLFVELYDTMRVYLTTEREKYVNNGGNAYTRGYSQDTQRVRVYRQGKAQRRRYQGQKGTQPVARQAFRPTGLHQQSKPTTRRQKINSGQYQSNTVAVRPSPLNWNLADDGLSSTCFTCKYTFIWQLLQVSSDRKSRSMTNIIPILPYLPSLFPFFFFLFRRATRGYTIDLFVDCVGM